MKKFTFLFTLIVVSAMLLAACGGGSDNGTQGTSVPSGQATESTGGAGTSLTAEPTTGTGTGSDMGTATVPAGGETTPTVEAGTGGTGTETGTPTVAAGTGGTGGTTGGDLTQTPTASGGTGAIPQTGTSEQYVLLSNILKMQVQGQDGNQVGNVTGVVIDRASTSGSTSGSNSTGANSGSTSSGTTSSGTTSSGSTSGGSTAAGTATPTVSSGTGGSGSTGGNSGSTSSGSTSGSSASTVTNGETPRVAYVLVNVTGSSSDNSSTGSTSGSASGSDASTTPTATASTGGSTSGSTSGSGSSSKSGNQVLIPWQAFTVSGQGMGSVGSASNSSAGSNSGSTSGSGSATLTETPTVSGSTAGGATSGGATSGSSNSSSTGQSSSDMVLVLTVDSTTLAAAPSFDASAFNGQVGSDVASYWSGQVAGIPTTGESSTVSNQVLIQGQIGSISINGTQGENLGQVRDFVVDTTTGDIVYAVLSGGSTFQGNMYVVPVSEMTWQAGQGQGNDNGTFSMNVPTSVFSGAPSVSSVDEIGSDATWFSDVNSYWSGNNK